MIHYIDKSALVAEIERRRESNAKERYFGRLVEDNYFLDFLNSLEVKEVQEEPVSEDLEEAAEEWDESLYRSDAFKAGAKWQKAKDESMSEDLGEYINELSKQFPEVSFAKLSRIAVRVAKWQQEQMMANAVLETTIFKEDDGCAEDGNYQEWLMYEDSEIIEIPSWAKAGDKVKILVIKQE